MPPLGSGVRVGTLTPRRSRSPTVPTILAAVTNVLAAITTVFQPVTYILASIAHVLEAIAPTAVMQRVAPVLATVTDILRPVTPILAAITHIFATVADVLEAVTASGQGSVVKLGMERVWAAGLNVLCERQWRCTSEQGRGDRSHSEIAHRTPRGRITRSPPWRALLMRRCRTATR